jgi:predicted Zn finger-like uncharacterized protein
MRTVCPSCDATYEVPDAMLAGGPRLVKCARCGGEWTATAAPPPEPTAAPTAEPTADPPPSVTAEQPPPPPKPAGPMAALEADQPGRIELRPNPLRSRTEPRATPTALDDHAPAPVAARKAGAGPIAAWILSLAVLIGAGGAVVTWRTQVMAAWPPSERVFAAVGLR